MFEVKLTIGFNPEAVALLTAIIGGAKLTNSTEKPWTDEEIKELTERHNKIFKATDTKEIKKGVKVEKQTAPVNGHTEEKEEVEESGDTATKVVTLEMARAAVVKKTQAGFRDEVKKLLGEYDVTKVTDLAAKHYAEFLTKVEALK